MLTSFLNAILSRLAFIWRSFGSPRIAGDTRAVDAVRRTWANRGRAAEVGSGLSTRVRNTVIASSGVVIAALVIWLVFMGFGSGDGDGGGSEELEIASTIPTPTPYDVPLFLTEVAALSSAIGAARESGLVSDDFAHIARRITFGEFAEAIGEGYRAERGLLETTVDTEIWAFAFSGDVELQFGDDEKVNYNNLTVVLDALTGHVYRVEAFYGEYESEARAPVWLRPQTPTPVPRQ